LNEHIAQGFLALLFLIGALEAAFAKRHRDYVIKQLNSPWYVPKQRALGVFMMLVAVAAVLVRAANYGIDLSWLKFKL
jgi:hypothetical protein